MPLVQGSYNQGGDALLTYLAGKKIMKIDFRKGYWRGVLYLIVENGMKIPGLINHSIHLGVVLPDVGF